MRFQVMSLLPGIAIACSLAGEAYGLDVVTHERLNQFISTKEDASIRFSFNDYLTSYLGLAGAKVNGRDAYGYVVGGGRTEDKPPSVAPYIRSVNHFHDPATEKGFTGILDTHLLSGQSALLWAQSPILTQTPGGPYSWLDARDNYYRALVSQNQGVRDVLLGEALRGVGQVMHLVQDMSVPEHSRNDGHYTEAYEEWVAAASNSGIVNAALKKAKYPDPSLLATTSFTPSAPVPIANLFDSNRYDGSNPADTPALYYGLSEYSGANFISADTIFSSAYPYPAWSSTQEYEEEIAPGTGKVRIYLRKIADGEQVDHLAVGGLFYKYLPTFMKSAGYGLELDDKVYADYAALLLPRAVGYSAAAMEYFFRGKIELTVPTPQNEYFSNIRLKARNLTASGEEMINPQEIKLVIRYKSMREDAAQGKIVMDGDAYQYLVVPLKNAVSTIPKDVPIDLEFDLSASPLPMRSYDVTLQVVYQGQLGNESGAVAVGMVTLPSIGGDIELALPAKGIYGMVAPGGSFSDFRVRAKNVSSTGAAMPDGNVELVLQYKLAQQDPFQGVPTDKSPADPERYYVRVPEKNGVRSIPAASPVDLVFDLSGKPLPPQATDLHAYVVYTGQVGQNVATVAVGHSNIAEPTPIDIINNMDHVCINGSYLVAGSQDAISAVGSDSYGDPLSDVYPHRLKDVYLSFSATPASSTNYAAKFPLIEPGATGRVYVLSDYNFNVSSDVTVEDVAPLKDEWMVSFPTTVESISGVANDVFKVEGNYVEYYPAMYTERGIKSWWYTHYENPEWPDGAACDSSTAPDLAGPVTVEFNQ